MIFCLVGASGCGKTSAAKHIEKSLHLPVICSYTTRPKREGETDGIEHFFVTEEEMPSRESMLAYTYFGGYHYWATKEQASRNCIYVIDEDGVRELMRFADEFTILPIYINKECIDVDSARKERDRDRRPLRYDSYISHIDNNGTMYDFLYNVVEQINLCLHNQWWVEQWYRIHKKDIR